jgi:hypothetical protein
VNERLASSAGEQGYHSDARSRSGAFQQVVSQGLICFLMGKSQRSHPLRWKRTPSPTSLLKQAFEILPRCDDLRLAIDRARASSSGNAACHASLWLRQRVVRPRLSACPWPFGRRQSGDILSRAPDSPQKKNGGRADHACWEYSGVSGGRHYTCQLEHGIPQVVLALLGA